MTEALFSLDIGTRTVVGVVSVLENDIYKVIDYEIKSHPERAMFDGQIHDIEKVTRVVQEVKQILEERTGLTFKKVAIAAAGRALKTVKVSVDRPLDIGQGISQELINNVEMEAVQMAQYEVEKTHQAKAGHYYCVGYSVCHYLIDQVININPRDHHGESLSVILIATFLPHIVVDGLYTVVDRAGLEVLNMTLEPIAAINIAIPSNLRLLNLALVDIGAGTSDIAITKDGTVVSFGMVASAGDKFTEAIAQTYLLDFDQAEQLKMGLNQKDIHVFQDIIGISHEVTTEEVVKAIEEVYVQTSLELAKQIIEFNEKPPSAVFCIGGGSQMPKFTEYLAEALGLAKERVVIKPVESIEKIEFAKEILKGPAMITPLGIGMTALREKEKDFLQVMVNDKSVRMLNAKTLSVSDALILVGYHARALLPERGKNIDFYLNKEKKQLKGGYGEAAEIYINGKKASLDVKLKHKDRIQVSEGKKGQDASGSLKTFLEPFYFLFNDEKLCQIYEVKSNDHPKALDEPIGNGEDISYLKFVMVKDILTYKGLSHEGIKTYVNGSLVTLDKVIESSDIIRTQWDVSETEEKKTVKKPDFMSKKEMSELESDHFKMETVEEKTKVEMVYNYSLMVNGMSIQVEQKDRKMVFVDVFQHIDFDISRPQGILQLQLNGQKANYTDFLKDGDVIEIKWQK